MQYLPLLDRVWFARIFSVFIGSLSIPVGFSLCRKVFRNDAIAIGITAFIVVMPEFAINLSRVSNECLSVAIYTTLFLAVCHWLDRPESFVRAITIGALLGFGLLTKAYFLTAVPALCVLYFWLCMTQSQKRSIFLKSATATFVVGGAMSGWWYVRNILQTGTVSGLDEALLLRGVGTGEKLLAVVHVQWVKAIATVLLSHIWYGGWNLLSLPRFIYYAGFVCIIVAILGLLKTRRTLIEPKLFCLSNFYAWFWLGQGYQILALFLSKASSTSMGGWYLYCVIWAESVLFAIGIFAMVPVRIREATLSILICGVAVLDLYAVHFVALPSFVRTDRFDLHIAKLVINRPEFLTDRLWSLLWVAFLSSTVLAAFAGARALHHSGVSERRVSS